jgi:hypothetical protein
VTGQPAHGAGKTQQHKVVLGQFDSECLGYYVAQDTFYLGTKKGVGRVHQQTIIDACTKVGFAKRNETGTPITAAGMPNDHTSPR